MAVNTSNWYDPKFKPKYGGERIRIRQFFTSQVLAQPTGWHNCTIQGNGAWKTLESNTLSIDNENQGRYNFAPEYNETIQVAEYSSEYDFTRFEKLRKLIDRDLPEENRLIVVFAYLSPPGGLCVLSPKWLPWVLVDPRYTQLGDQTLMHEIGHACRLAHTEHGVMNVYGERSDALSYMESWEIYRSYWCTGPRPKAWYQHRPDKYTPQHYLWAPFDKPSPAY